MAASGSGADAGHPREVIAFVARFDRREYWLAHEELEALWLAERSDFLKGLIQIAAAFVHIDRENWNGGRSLVASALGYLEDVAGNHRGFDVAALRDHLGQLAEHVEALRHGTRKTFDEALRPRLAAFFEGEIPAAAVEPRELPYRVRRYEEGYRLGGADADDLGDGRKGRRRRPVEDDDDD